MEHAQAVRQFKTLNRERIQRLSELLPSRSHFFLDLLPLLFQMNTSTLPGYISENTPAGITDYQPSNATLDAAKKLNHAFLYKRHSLRYYPIRGLYLINDKGIYNYNRQTELELWLIHAPALSNTHTAQLQQKLSAICGWAHTLNIKLRARLLDEATLTSKILTSFDLDRFYHSGLLLAGCTPLWWTTAPEKSNHTPTTLPRNDASFSRDVIDFGTLAMIDAQSLFDLAIEQINYAMNEGLEGCLDLIYLNKTLEDYPNINWLCQNLKKAIYDDITDPLQLDIATLKLNAISHAGNIDRTSISLAQQSLYVLSGERLSRTVRQVRYPWRHAFIEQQVESWRWPHDTLANLDKRFQAHFRQCRDEFQQVKSQVLASMQSVISFAKHHQLKIQNQRRELEQKFEALYETGPDTINRLPLALFPQSSEEHIYLSRANIDADWRINDLPRYLSKDSLYQHHSLLNVLAWAINNHLLAKSTRLKVADQSLIVTMSVVLDLVHHLLRSPLSLPPNVMTDEQYKNADNIEQLLLFANLEHQPSDILSQHGLKLSSLQSDPLNYANSKQNLVVSIEGLIHSSGGQWHYFAHSGPTAVLDMLATVIHWAPSQNTALSTTCWCPFGNYSQIIRNRIEMLYSEVITHIIDNPTSGNYLVSIADKLYRLQWQDNELCDYTTLPKNKQLLQHLAQEKPSYSATKVDPLLDKDSLFAMLFKHQVTHQITLFLYSQNLYTTLYIIDELGSLYMQHVVGLTEATLTSHFHHFLDSVNTNNKIDRINFFRVSFTENIGWQTTQIKLSASTIAKTGYLPVTVEMDSPKESASCTVYCGSKQFNGKANEIALFKQVSDLVLGLRKSSKHYPLYITQLSFKQPRDITTHHYIIQKQRLEYLLNKT